MIFLGKKSGKNLDTYHYAYNLKVYFEQTRRLKNISLEDLGCVLSILCQSSKENTFEAEGEHVPNYYVGEHVAVFFYGEKTMEHLDCI